MKGEQQVPENLRKNPEHEPNPDYNFQVFQQVSGAEPDTIEQVKTFFKDLPNLPKDSFAAAQAVRAFLIDRGFQYDGGTFCIQDMMREKRGNCLGLSLLIGAVLREKGFQVDYRIILNPKDAIYQQDLRLFEELHRGDHFDYENPVLPKQKAEVPAYRFAPLEHPSLFLDGKPFETTGLEDVEEDAGWLPEAERVQSATFEQVASNIYIDRAKLKISSGDELNTSDLQQLCGKAISLWEDNREAYALLWDIAEEENNQTLKEKCLRRYKEIGGDDSRFHFTLYKMTGDTQELGLALSQFQAHIEAFVERDVVLEDDPREKKFNLAVALWCAANSSALDLKRLYLRFEQEIKDLYGEQVYQRAIKSL